MSPKPKPPSVYIEEIPGGVKPMAGVGTSIAAFISFFNKGPVNKAVHVVNMSEFENIIWGIR